MSPVEIVGRVHRASGTFLRVNDANAMVMQISVIQRQGFVSIVAMPRPERIARNVPMDIMAMRDWVPHKSASRACVQVSIADQLGQSIDLSRLFVGGPGSTQQFGDSCVHDPYTQQVVCRCRPGYTGPRCAQCAIAYYGSPTEPGGRCQSCSCNNNINVDDPESCDRRTGVCLRCLYNTAGSQCETCRAGFYGDAFGPDKCVPCDCGIGGVADQICNARSGTCVCKEHVEDTKTGRRCSQCVDGYWGLGRGFCSDCKCHPDGSESSVCDKFTGQCRCKPNRGGLRCDQCPPGTYGDPNACQPCQCSNDGAISSECDPQTGQCSCKPGVTGQLCDRCARAKYGVVPYCSTCGACFTNWDTIVNSVTRQVQVSIQRLSSVETRQLESITNGYLFEQVDSLLEQAQIALGLRYTSNELDPYRYKYQTILDRLHRLTSLLNDEFQPEFLNQTKRFRYEEDVSHVANVVNETYKLLKVHQKQFDRAKHADLQSAGISAQTIDQELIELKRELAKLVGLTDQQQTRLVRLNETIVSNNINHRTRTDQVQEQLKSLSQNFDDLQEKYVVQVSVDLSDSRRPPSSFSSGQRQRDSLWRGRMFVQLRQFFISMFVESSRTAERDAQHDRSDRERLGQQTEREQSDLRSTIRSGKRCDTHLQ